MLAWAPGRINLIGGHTDYNEGLALPAAINRWISVAMRPRRDGIIRVRSLDFGGELRGDLSGFSDVSASWQKFVAGSVAVFGARHPLPSASTRSSPVMSRTVQVSRRPPRSRSRG